MKNKLEIGNGDRSLKLEVSYESECWLLTIEANDNKASILFDPSAIEVVALANFFDTARQILED